MPDYGLAGKVALVCGSSSGIGFACAEALAGCGTAIVMNGRDKSSLTAAAEVLRAHTGVIATTVVADVGRAEGREALLTRCREPDILVNNAAGPPTGDFRDFDEAAWNEALRGSMVAPILLIRAVIDAMMAKGFGRIVNITSSAVRAPLPLLGLSNGARSGLTGFVAGLAREVAHAGVTINNLLPGTIETDRLKSYVGSVAASRGVSDEQAGAEMAEANPTRRFGRPEEIGAYCAFLASRQAGYVTGQNLLVDGGAFRGV